MTQAHRVEILIAFVFAIATFTWWLGGYIERWPQRSPRRRVTDYAPGGICEVTKVLRTPAGGAIAEINARAVAGLPIWQIRALFDLSDVRLDTHADLSRWLLVLAAVEKRSREVRRLLETKREQLLLYGQHESDHIPEFLRINGDDAA